MNKQHLKLIKFVLFQDEKNQVLTTNIWLDQEWKDELLTWDPDQFHGIRKVRIFILLFRLSSLKLNLLNAWEVIGLIFILIKGFTYC